MGTTGRNADNGTTTMLARYDYDFLRFEFDATTQKVQCAVFQNGTIVRIPSKKKLTGLVTQREARELPCKGLRQALAEWPEDA